MKITVYELLGLVKDGKAPKKIKYDGQEYKITKILLEDNNYYFNYINEDMECIFPINTNCLNDEVEIIEEDKKDNFTGWKMYQDGKEVCSMDCSSDEDKKIETINTISSLGIFDKRCIEEYFKIVFSQQKEEAIKINELIYEVNKLKEEK